MNSEWLHTNKTMMNLCPYKNHMRGFTLKMDWTWFSWKNESETMVQSEKLCYSLSFSHSVFDSCSIRPFWGVERALLDSWSIHMLTDHVVVLQTRAMSCWCSISNAVIQDYFSGCCRGMVGLARMPPGRKAEREYAASRWWNEESDLAVDTKRLYV